MPDWFYRTCARPALFCLPDRAGRAIALGVIGTLGRSRAGRSLIELMGHMAPDPSSAVRLGSSVFASRVGLGWRVDPERRATRGLASFGVGCIEVWRGPHPSVMRAPNDSLQDVDPAFELSSGPIQEVDAALLLIRRTDDCGDEIVELPDGRELRVIGVVAHDRATFGGMLAASGVAMLLPVLWCFRRGERWLWSAIAGLGAPAYGAALGIHLAVGYVDWRHMVPAVAGLVFWLGGLLLAAGYLRGRTTREAGTPQAEGG